VSKRQWEDLEVAAVRSNATRAIGAPEDAQAHNATPASSDEKLAELILYISQKCADDLYYGATKLNKILYFSDFLFYGRTGRAITGAEYQKLKNGPGPRRLAPVRNALIKKKRLAIQPVSLLGGIQHHLVNLDEPKIDPLFSASEIAMVDEVISTLSDASGTECSKLSYEFTAGLKHFRERETIPFATILISNEAPTEVEVLRGQEIAAKFSLLNQ